MRPKQEFTTNHRGFGATKLRQQGNFTQRLVVMVETFRMSDFEHYEHYEHYELYKYYHQYEHF